MEYLNYLKNYNQQQSEQIRNEIELITKKLEDVTKKKDEITNEYVLDLYNIKELIDDVNILRNGYKNLKNQQYFTLIMCLVVIGMCYSLDMYNFPTILFTDVIFLSYYLLSTDSLRKKLKKHEITCEDENDLVCENLDKEINIIFVNQKQREYKMEELTSLQKNIRAKIDDLKKKQEYQDNISKKTEDFDNYLRPKNEEKVKTRQKSVK